MEVHEANRCTCSSEGSFQPLSPRRGCQVRSNRRWQKRVLAWTCQSARHRAAPISPLDAMIWFAVTFVARGRVLVDTEMSISLRMLQAKRAKKSSCTLMSCKPHFAEPARGARSHPDTKEGDMFQMEQSTDPLHASSRRRSHASEQPKLSELSHSLCPGVLFS